MPDSNPSPARTEHGRPLSSREDVPASDDVAGGETPPNSIETPESVSYEDGDRSLDTIGSTDGDEVQADPQQDLLARKSEQIAELRSKLLETRRSLNAKLEDARAEIRELKRRLALYERRVRMKDVDARDHNREASMDHYFAENTDPEPYVRFGAALRLQLKRFGISLDGRSVGDAGVGPGYALKELLRGSHPIDIYGFDFSSTAIETARREIPAGRFERRDIYGEPADSFDVVLCTEVLEHLERPADALRMLVRMVKPDGYLILTVPDGRIDFSDKHVNFWSPESWTFFLRQTLPQHTIRTATFQPYPETGHQTNIAVVRKSQGRSDDNP